MSVSHWCFTSRIYPLMAFKLVCVKDTKALQMVHLQSKTAFDQLESNYFLTARRDNI